MPTYSYRCKRCGEISELFRSIADYTANPLPLVHCGIPMCRYFCYDASRAVDNPLAGDRHYDGLRTLDGVDVSTRSKHRAYMKERGLTTCDDFTQQWKQQAQERADRLAGIDPKRREDIERAIAHPDTRPRPRST